MIISRIGGGIGNQLFTYAAGRRLAHKWNTEFKLDISVYEKLKGTHYDLSALNIIENFATPEEIARLKKFREGTNLGKEKIAWQFFPEVLDYPDDLYVSGNWEDERYFADISDIIRQEFTFKRALGTAAQDWKVKILAAENSVSLHFRHGDFVTQPQRCPSGAILPLDYYYTCVNILKEQYKNLTLFIFSNNLQWVKENLRAGLPTEFVEGDGLQDIEELYLMSLCKHNIIAPSTFSWWGAWLNQNPDKKVFMPIPSSDDDKKGYRYSPIRNENSSLDSDRWIRIPFDFNAQASVTTRPWFSLLLVVNNDINTLVESLNSIIGQNYKYFELIIIDNASTDGSGKILQQVAKTLDNVTLIKLYAKVQNGAAWNIALNAAQGKYVMFLKGNDRLLANALTIIYSTNEYILDDVANSVAYLKADEHGDIDIAGRKFFLKKMPAFQNMNGFFNGKLDKLSLLRIFANDEKFFPIATRVFKRTFLKENKIRFNEKIGDDAENFFTLDAMFQTEEIMFSSLPFYVAP